jgi:membrane dipeptidase
MTQVRHIWFVALFPIVFSACSRNATPLTDEQLRMRSKELAEKFHIVDTHIDVPYRLLERMENISERTLHGEFDFPRAREGGLDAAFMSIYVPASYEEGGAREFADSLIDMVMGFSRQWPEKFAPAFSPNQVVVNSQQGRVSLPMGMENGSPLEGTLDNVRYFYDRGIRYITLTHSRNNHLCDSSYDKERKWNGLSPFGTEVVAEMNRLGIMIDISHVSDSTFYQVIRLSRAPVIASHSSCRKFTPEWERNMSDDMIRLLARNGGVIQINFGSSFLSGDLQKKWSVAWDELGSYLEEHKLSWTDDEAIAVIKKYREDHGVHYADISDVVAHIDHVVGLVGDDHIGFGSDFDGVGDSLPAGIKDVSMYPNLIYELLKKGYTEESVKKICGENLLRVWREVDQVATDSQKAGD